MSVTNKKTKMVIEDPNLDAAGSLDMPENVKKIDYPGSVDEVSKSTLGSMLCRPGSEFEGFTVEDFTIDSDLMGMAGNSFAGCLVGVSVVLKKRGDSGQEEKKEVHLALKFPPKDEQQRKMVCEWFNFFPREVEIYSVFFPAVEAFLEAHHPESAIKWRQLMPKCYFAATDSSPPRFEACIALEDLRRQDYKAGRLSVGATIEQCMLIMSHAAFLHAVSTCFIIVNPGFANPKNLRYINVDPFSPDDGVRIDEELGEQKRVGYAKSLQFVCKLTEETGLLSPEELDRLKAVFGGVADLHASDAYKAKRGPLLVNHGDLTLCNVMVTPNNDVKFIDFQMSQVADLMVDLILFLYTSLKTVSVRKQGLVKLLKFYHQELFRNIALLGFESQVTYAYEDFAQDFAEKCLIFGIPRLGFALFLNLADREDFEAAGPGGSIVTVLDAVATRAKKGELSVAKAEPLTSVMIELLRMKPENVM